MRTGQGLDLKKDLDKKLWYNLDIMIRENSYSKIVEAAPKDLMEQLSMDRLEFKSFTEALVRRGEITMIDHHIQDRKMILINADDHEGQDLQESPFRMCRAVYGNELRNERHLVHSDRKDNECILLALEFWAKRTTRAYNKDQNKPKTQTYTSESIKVPSESLSAALNTTVEPKYPEERLVALRHERIQFPDMTSKLFYVVEQGYVTQDGKKTFANLEEVGKYWQQHWKKKIPTKLQLDLGRRRKEYYNRTTGRKEKVWESILTKEVFTDYGEPLEVTQPKDKIKKFFKTRIESIKESIKSSNLQSREDAYTRKNHLAMQKKRRNELAKKARRNMKIYNSPYGPSYLL